VLEPHHGILSLKQLATEPHHGILSLKQLATRIEKEY
jgi:hypothetical protein